ncbi:MAG: hypothetical protein A2V66_17800 [Ignavibacteria bacterium RBG_13_36_8]|nr:MAG: hypothetical protein A2V66_17800 [Ignavibacteria bacterium RBG_13_36_8]
MKESDVIIFGTPIYWWGPTAQFKTFFDRFYGINPRGFFKEKYILLVTPFESKDRKTSEYTIGMIKTSVEWIGVKEFESFSVPGVANKDDAANRSGLLKQAGELGKSLVMKYKKSTK